MPAPVLRAVVLALCAAAASAQSSADDKCAMCEYLIENADRAIKNRPRVVAGGGAVTGTMDFKGGNVKGNFNPTGFLEEISVVKRRQRGQRGQHWQRGQPHRRRRVREGGSSGVPEITSIGAPSRLRAARPDADAAAAAELSSMSSSPSFLERGASSVPTADALENILEHQYDPLDSIDEGVARRDEGGSQDGFIQKLSGGLMRFVGSTDGAGVSLGAGKIPKRTLMKPPLSGKLGDHMKMLQTKEADRTSEFDLMYTNFMDAMEGECARLPKSWQAGCKPLFKDSDKVVEMYLHEYSTWDICLNIPKDTSSPCKGKFDRV